MDDFGTFYGLDGAYDPAALNDWTMNTGLADPTAGWGAGYDPGSAFYSSGGSDGIYNPAGDTYAVDATGDITSIL